MGFVALVIEGILRLTFLGSFFAYLLSFPSQLILEWADAEDLTYLEVLRTKPLAGLYWVLRRHRSSFGRLAVSSGVLAALALLFRWPGLGA